MKSAKRRYRYRLLLRVLQEKQFSRLGGDTLITADFRLITASNKDLRQLVASGEFRQDLYYRINILELSLPALRQRPGDIMLLIQHLLYQQGRQITFTPDAVDFLHRYSWLATFVNFRRLSTGSSSCWISIE